MKCQRNLILMLTKIKSAMHVHGDKEGQVCTPIFIIFIYLLFVCL